MDISLAEGNGFGVFADAKSRGIPIGTAIGYGIYVSMDMGDAVPCRFPWMVVCVAAIAVFIVVFITMLYAVSRLRKDNPIEAIRISALQI